MLLLAGLCHPPAHGVPDAGLRGLPLHPRVSGEYINKNVTEEFPSHPCFHFSRTTQIFSGIWVQLQVDLGAGGGGGGGGRGKARLRHPVPTADAPGAMGAAACALLVRSLPPRPAR